MTGKEYIVPESDCGEELSDYTELIRCKDCKWWPYHPIERQIGYVKTFLCAIPPASKEDANGFCSMAEREEE